ncbi:hypothetical protein Tco_1343746 [Tanacetum coccineum]
MVITSIPNSEIFEQLALIRYHQEELYIHKEEMAHMALSDSEVAFDLLRDALSAIFGLSELKIGIRALAIEN